MTFLLIALLGVTNATEHARTDNLADWLRSEAQNLSGTYNTTHVTNAVVRVTTAAVRVTRDPAGTTTIVLDVLASGNGTLDLGALVNSSSMTCATEVDQAPLRVTLVVSDVPDTPLAITSFAVDTSAISARQLRSRPWACNLALSAVPALLGAWSTAKAEAWRLAIERRVGEL